MAAFLALSLCACGGESYGVKTVLTLVEQEYSLAFRNDDVTYYYVAAAIEKLNADGTVPELAYKWFGKDITTFGNDADAIEEIGMPAPRRFCIGLDPNAFPVSYSSSGTYWGFDIQLAMAVCEFLGWELVLQPIEKEEVYTQLYSGNIDCAWGGIALDEKDISAGKYTVYGPYLKNDIVIASRDRGGIWNTLQLGGANVAMPTTPEASAALSSNEKIAKRLKQVTRLAGGTTACFTYLYSGKCDAVLTDSTALYYYNSH